MKIYGGFAFRPKADPPRAGVAKLCISILYSVKLQKRYVGLADDLKRRVGEHKRGASSFTARVQDWKLVYYECFGNKKDAAEEEKFLKTGKGRERMKYLLKNTIYGGFA